MQNGFLSEIKVIYFLPDYDITYDDSFIDELNNPYS